MRKFEEVLPKGYKEVYCIDTKEPKTILLQRLVKLFITMIGIGLSIYLIPIENPAVFKESIDLLSLLSILLLLGIIIYLFLHTLTHSLVYKKLTRQKFVYGTSLTIAYCGIPNIFVYRRTALLALVTPLIVFTIILLPIVFIVGDPLWKLFFAFLLSVHIGNCIDDIYKIMLLLVRLKDPSILMEDTGPQQTFYNNIV